MAAQLLCPSLLLQRPLFQIQTTLAVFTVHKITSSLLVNKLPAAGSEVELWGYLGARWLPRNREALLAAVHCSLEDPAAIKMLPFGVDLDLKTQVLEVSAYRQGRAAAAQAHEAASTRAMGSRHTYITASPWVPALMLPQATRASFRCSKTVSSISGHLHMPSSPHPFTGSCLLILWI